MINFQEYSVRSSGRENTKVGSASDFIRPLAERTFLLLALPMVLVVFGLIASVIALTSTGPVLLRLHRVNADGKSFNELRFRCIWMDAAARHFQAQSTGEPLTRDPRLTPVGDFLIRTGLNRLPRVFNVLKGDLPLSSLNETF